MLKEDTVPENATPVSTPTSTEGVLYEGKTAEQWARIVTSLRGELNQRAQTIKTLEAQLGSTIVENERLRQEAETNSTKAQSLENDLTTTKTTLESELAKLRSRDELARTIAEKYPQLLELHYKGLVNPGDKQGDELLAYLDTFANQLAQFQTSAVQQFRQGTPPPPPNPVTKPGDKVMKRGVNTIAKELSRTSASDPRHAELMAEYEEAIREGRLHDQ